MSSRAVFDLTITRANALASFEYRDGNLYWRVAVGAARPGDVVGSLCQGHRKFTWRQRTHYAHRVIWLMHHGVWPEHQIDHINGKRDDNRIENLRPATNTENARSMNVVRSRTGFKGVTVGGRAFVASIMVNRQRVHLGCFDDPADAARRYDSAAREHFGEFARTNADLGLLGAAS